MSDSEQRNSRTGAVPVFGPKSEGPPEQAPKAHVSPPPAPPQQNSTPQQSTGTPPPARVPGTDQGRPHRTSAHLGAMRNTALPRGNADTSGIRYWPFVVGGIAVIALVLVVVLVASILSMNAPNDGSVDAAPDSSEAEPDSADSVDPADSLEGQDLSPEEKLENLKDDTWDKYADELDGEWVVQLSAKNEGMEADGYTWTNEDIVEHFEELHDIYPDAVLLWSGDWSSYNNSDFWVIVRSITYSDSDSALNFCYDEGFGRDDCMAKHLFTTGAPDDTSEYMS